MTETKQGGSSFDKIKDVLPDNVNEILKQLTDMQSETEREKFLVEHGDWLTEQGIPNIWRLSISNKVETITLIVKQFVYYRTAAEIAQFVGGMQSIANFWTVVKSNAEIFKPLFCYSVEPLTKGATDISCGKKDYLEERKRFKELRLQEAKENGELMECACCYDDECLFDDMSACEDGHLFCKECIRRSSEVVVGQGKTEFPCITGTCEYKFSLGVLQSVLPSNMFSIILKRMQEEEIKMADIPDLVSCPFCSYATIMPNQDDKVFKCLNPECLKESCRLCQEPNHIPLRCNEVEKRGETDMRTYIESRLTEAMLRKCHRCNKYFVKEFGCNKMTCTCGATSCYVCRAKDIDYDHFDGREGRERCTNEGDMNKLHREEMEKAALAAKEQYLKDHPEASKIELKYDPLKLIDDFGGLKEDYGDDEEGSIDEEEEEREEEREEYNSDYYESD